MLFTFWVGLIPEICSIYMVLPRRKLESSLQSVHLPHDFTPQRKYVVWSLSTFLSQTCELFQISIHLIFCFFCFSEETVSLLLSKTNFFSFVLHPVLKLYSLNYFFSWLNLLSFFFYWILPCSISMCRCPELHRGNPCPLGLHLSPSHYCISWSHCPCCVSWFFPSSGLLFSRVQRSSRSLFGTYIPYPPWFLFWHFGILSEGRIKCRHQKVVIQNVLVIDQIFRVREERELNDSLVFILFWDKV